MQAHLKTGQAAEEDGADTQFVQEVVVSRLYALPEVVEQVHAQHLQESSSYSRCCRISARCCSDLQTVLQVLML